MLQGLRPAALLLQVVEILEVPQAYVPTAENNMRKLGSEVNKNQPDKYYRYHYEAQGGITFDELAKGRWLDAALSPIPYQTLGCSKMDVQRKSRWKPTTDRENKK